MRNDGTGSGGFELIDPPPLRDPGPRERREGRRPRLLRRLVSLALGAAFFYVLYHEACSAINIECLRQVHNTGVELANSTARGDTREYLLGRLKEKRDSLDHFNSQWLSSALTGDTRQTLAAAVETVDLLSGKSIPPDPSGGLGGLAGNKLRNFLLHSGDWRAQMLTRPALNAVGLAMTTQAEKQMRDRLADSWVLKRLPKDTLWKTEPTPR